MKSKIIYITLLFAFISTVAAAPPTVESIDFDPSNPDSGDPVDITVEADDDGALRSVAAYYGGSWHSKTCNNLATCTREFTYYPSSSGDKTIKARATDDVRHQSDIETEILSVGSQDEEEEIEFTRFPSSFTIGERSGTIEATVTGDHDIEDDTLVLEYHSYGPNTYANDWSSWRQIDSTVCNMDDGECDIRGSFTPPKEKSEVRARVEGTSLSIKRDVMADGGISDPGPGDPGSGSVTVVVRDSGGDPLDNADVQLRGATGQNYLRNQDTNFNGKTTFSNLQDGQYQAEVDCDDSTGYEDVWINNGEDETLYVDLNINPVGNDCGGYYGGGDDGEIDVEVQNTNFERVGGARVFIESTFLEGTRNRYSDTMYTDRNGNVDFNNVPLGNYEVTATCRNNLNDARVSDSVRIDDLDSSEDITLRFRSFYQESCDIGGGRPPRDGDEELEVNVRDSGFDRLENARVEITNGDYQAKFTRSDGRTTFYHLSRGYHDVRVSCDGEIRNRRNVYVDGRDEITVEFLRDFRFDDCGEDDDIGNRPRADFSFSPGSPEVDERVRFDAGSSRGNIDEYRWFFGDGDDRRTSSRTVSHTYRRSGTYTVTLVVEDFSGDTDRTTRTVVVGQDRDSCGINSDTVKELKLGSPSIEEGESTDASIVVENQGTESQRVNVRITGGGETWLDTSRRISGADSREFSTSVSPSDDALIQAEVETEGQPCGSQEFTSSEELIVTEGDSDPGFADLEVQVEDDEGDEMEDARVDVENGDDRTRFTDSDGEASFSNLEAGDYDVEVTCNGESEDRSIELEDSETRNLDIEFDEEFDSDVCGEEDRDEEGELTVIVENEDGDRLSNARVRAVNGDDRVRYTNSVGRAEFDLEEDRYDIIVTRSGYRREVDSISIDEGDDERIVIEMRRDNDDDDDFETGGIEITGVSSPSSVCRGDSFSATVDVENNGDSSQFVSLTGSGLGSVSLGRSFTVTPGEVDRRSLRFTNVRGSGFERFTIRVSNHDTDTTSRSIRVENCGSTGGGTTDPEPATGQVSLTSEVSPSRLTIGRSAMVKGYVNGVSGRTDVRIQLDGRTAARVSTQPDGYYQAFITPESTGTKTVTISAAGETSQRELRVIPTAAVSGISAPDKVFEGETFEICADVESQDTPKVFLTDGDEVLETKNDKGEVCFERTASDVGTHDFSVRASIQGQSSKASKAVRVLESGSEVSNFPDQVASVESEPGLVKVELYNTHEESRRYMVLISNIDSRWVSQSEKEVVLQKGERETVFFYINAQEEGRYSPTIDVDSQGSTIFQQQIDVSVVGSTQERPKSLFQRIFGSLI